MKTIKSLLLLLTLGSGLAFALSSCEAPLAETQEEFDGDCWSMRDSVSLIFENTDTSAIYRLYFPVTFTEDYSYSNVYLHALVTSPSGDVNLLPARFDLMDKIGNWYSQPSGDEIPFKLSVEDGLRFNQLGNYSVKLYQYMRDEPLCGIRSSGIVVEEVPE